MRLTIKKNTLSMQQIIIELKDDSKLHFLLELLRQMDFIELQVKQTAKQEGTEGYNFFKSAGLFSGRQIDADQIRKQAWRITK
jgi:hypothetical protein